MAKYIYPARFTFENGQYSVQFIDLPGCIAQGDDLNEAVENAADALCLMLYHMEQRGESAPAASNPIDITTEKGQFISLISCDTFEYEKFYKSRAVKKTLTIPEWLNDMAVKANVNFSNTLQNALMTQLSINR